MNYILFDDQSRNSLLPFTFMRPVADIRTGILTIREKWEHYLKTTTSSLTETYLSGKFPIEKGEKNILINGSILPTEELAKEVSRLQPQQALVNADTIIALHIESSDLDESIEMEIEGIDDVESKADFLKINETFEIFHFNDRALRDDYDLITRGRKSRPVSDTNRVIGKENVFIEEGARVECSALNATTGPIYLGKNSEVMEGCIIRGPFALGESSILKMGAKIYGPTTIGPFSKVGGEVSSSVIFGFSNKAHDGFLGHSVIGEWCNLGADTNTSNLKNSYDKVRLWNYAQQSFVNTGLQFCGLIMGDHSKCGINTMFNTGTVVGVNSNIFGAGFQRNFVPSFSWGGTSGFKTYDIHKAMEVAEAVYKRRNLEFSDADKEILVNVFDITHDNRSL